MIKKLNHEEISGKRVSLDAVASIPRVPFIAMIDSVRSLYNIGSIFRSADGAMISELILTGLSPYPPRKEIEKTSLGSTRTVPWKYVKDPNEAIIEVKKKGYKICCLEITDSSKPITDIDFNDFPLCMVIGNEITGVSQEIINRCECAFEIPMYGYKHSLNVSVAFGIAAFAAAEKWISHARV